MSLSQPSRPRWAFLCSHMYFGFDLSISSKKKFLRFRPGFLSAYRSVEGRFPLHDVRRFSQALHHDGLESRLHQGNAPYDLIPLTLIVICFVGRPGLCRRAGHVHVGRQCWVSVARRALRKQPPARGGVGGTAPPSPLRRRVCLLSCQLPRPGSESLGAWPGGCLTLPFILSISASFTLELS